MAKLFYTIFSIGTCCVFVYWAANSLTDASMIKSLFWFGWMCIFISIVAPFCLYMSRRNRQN